jgi:Na+/H+-translocating membrane pyrophosphatase
MFFLTGTMILAGSLAYKANLEVPENYIFFPLVIHALDLLISGVGIMLVRSESDREVYTHTHTHTHTHANKHPYTLAHHV